MKSLMLLWQTLANETASRCCTSAAMDIKTVHGRVEHEGLSFLTITLPAFGKDFEKSLEEGAVSRHHFPGFARKGGLPRFAGGFLERVFDRESGVLLDEPCIDSILAVRQLTLMFGKILLPCSDARERGAMLGYIQTEEELRATTRDFEKEFLDDFSRVSHFLYRGVFEWANNNVHHTQLLPKHGPGATADGLLGNEKYGQHTWPQRLEKVLPSGSFLTANGNSEEILASVDLLEPGAEVPVKVISVPKTLKTPRIIGVEPTAMQYAQQSVLPVVLDSLERDTFLSGALGFQDQEPNRQMAWKGSLDGDLATLDLSEASDRVSNELVLRLFGPHPQLSEVVQATRSRIARVRGQSEVIRLAKFASMGSALCFPVEAMVFLTLILMGIEKDLEHPLSRKEFAKLYAGRVRVFGDDIIIPKEHVQSVIDTLQLSGAVVNVSKSFWKGSFRESCGKEFYNGEDVSIVRVRREFPESRADTDRVVSLIELRNQLYQAGYWQTVKWLDERIRGVIKHFPTVLPTSPVQGRWSYLGFETQRINPDTHSPEVKGYVISANEPSNRTDGHGALLKCLLMLERANEHRLPTVFGDHLNRSGRPKSAYLKLRWASAL